MSEGAVESITQRALKKALGGELEMADGQKVWLDEAAVVAILKKLDGFQFRIKTATLTPNDPIYPRSEP